MPEPRVTVIVPTLAAGTALDECVRSVAAQSVEALELIVVDNSGAGKAATLESVRSHAKVIENRTNLGFGSAVNQGIRCSKAPFVAVLNDDAVAHPECIANLLDAANRYEIGMCAPQIRRFGAPELDSAGMAIARDGSSKQRGHGRPFAEFSRPSQCLLPSGCAALYRRDMLDEIGLFDEHYFLYCEDTDLGLRARWKLWECAYVPGAIVEHRYSQSAGAASSLKAYYVERNRIFTIVRNFPAPQLLAAPFWSLVRYYWHLAYLRQGRGKAAQFENKSSLPLVLLKAWFDAGRALPRLLKERRQIRRTARATPRQFARMLASHRISERQVAAL